MRDTQLAIALDLISTSFSSACCPLECATVVILVLSKFYDPPLVLERLTLPQFAVCGGPSPLLLGHAGAFTVAVTEDGLFGRYRPDCARLHILPVCGLVRLLRLPQQRAAVAEQAAVGLEPLLQHGRHRQQVLRPRLRPLRLHCELPFQSQSTCTSQHSFAFLWQ